MSYEITDGKGPRWIGDNLPELPKELVYAQSLPPKVTNKYVLFFGFEGPEPECALQQWYPSPFTELDPASRQQKHFHTSEQYMMYHKARLMGDEEVAEETLACKTPAEAKTLGRKVKGFDQAKWDERCDAIVEEGNFLKFSQNEEMGEMLLGTGDREIVETSPNDKMWGVGFNSDDALDHVGEWGQNRLGKALVNVRQRLRSGDFVKLN